MNLSQSRVDQLLRAITRLNHLSNIKASSDPYSKICTLPLGGRDSQFQFAAWVPDE